MDRLHRIDYVAERLDVSKQRAYELVRTGLLHAVRVGRSIRVSERALEQFIANGGRRHPTKAA